MTTKATRGRRPKHLPDGRAALLAAAIEAFSTHGFDGANLRSIARTANVDASLVRVHFGSKAQLWQACVDALEAGLVEPGQRMLALSQQTDRPIIDRLRDAIGEVAMHANTHPEHRQFVAQHAANTDEIGDIINRQLVKPIFDSIEPLISQGIEAGLIDAEHPAMYFCLLVHALHPPPGTPILMGMIAPEVGGEAFAPALQRQVERLFLKTPPDA